MVRLLEVANEKGYQRALEECLLPKTTQYVFDYALNESRGDFRFLLPLNNHSRVLDVGCGWGAVTCAFARTSGEVVAADSNIYTLQFLKIRAEQEELDNIKPVNIQPLDDARLPFADSYFDAVLLNGVLEWVGSATKENRPDEIQKKALKEIRRILKPGGKLYIGIENRIGYHYFLGAPDDHTRFKFTNLMPRWLSDKYMKIRTGYGYRTYTYGMLGYKSLLENAGFKKVDFYLPIQSYREPEYLIPLDDQKIINYYLNNHISRRTTRHQIVYFFTRILVAIRIFKFLVPNYSIITEAA
jgi:ubiquinone/menaquinone biosynthesis C-methylase UbiE